MAALASPLVPELIEVEILIRLPVKSLVRFRSVCKLWNSVICDPNFIQNHFNRNNGFIISPKEDEDDDYLIVYDVFKEGPCSLSIISHHNFIEFPISKPPYSSSDDQRSLCLVGSINGLVCIADETNYEFIILWNPAIHCFKKIIIPAAAADADDEKRYRYLLGFGWDSSANNYKVIAKPFDSKETALYSCNADNWSNHKAIDSDDAYYGLFPSVVVRGIPYWKRKWYTSHVLKFDVTNNQFNILDIIPVCGYESSLINLNDHLAIIEYTSKTGACVYRLDDEQNCIWSKLYAIDTTITQWTFMCCFNYGGGFVFNGIDNLYDPKSKEIKSLRRNNHHEEIPGVFRGFSYTPSMLSLQGMKPLGASIYEFTNALDEVSLEDKTT